MTLPSIGQKYISLKDKKEYTISHVSIAYYTDESIVTLTRPGIVFELRYAFFDFIKRFAPVDESEYIL